MVVVLQRVSNASVEIKGEKVSEIGKGLVLFLGIQKGDNEKDIDYLVNKIPNLRVFEDSSGKMNLSLKDIGGEILIVSEFTLTADCKKGLRPSFDKAAPPQEAKKLYETFIERLKQIGVPVKEGVFRSFMNVSLINEGPVTFVITTR